MTSLEPCPFCGSVKLWIGLNIWDEAVVECMNDGCCAIGPCVNAGMSGGSVEVALNMAANAWNKRVSKTQSEPCLHQRAYLAVRENDISVQCVECSEILGTLTEYFDRMESEQ